MVVFEYDFIIFYCCTRKAITMSQIGDFEQWGRIRDHDPVWWSLYYIVGWGTYVQLPVDTYLNDCDMISTKG